MACEVRIQPTALRELEDVVTYLSSFGSSTVKSFLVEWEKTLEELRDGTVKHRLSRMDVLARLGYRTVLLGSYVVLLFQDGNDMIVIAHLFHQSQDYADLVLRGI